MKVIATYIGQLQNGIPCVLYECEGGRWQIDYTEDIGTRVFGMIGELAAKKMIERCKESVL